MFLIYIQKNRSRGVKSGILGSHVTATFLTIHLYRYFALKTVRTWFVGGEEDTSLVEWGISVATFIAISYIIFTLLLFKS
jgi:hypothetical protein